MRYLVATAAFLFLAACSDSENVKTFEPTDAGSNSNLPTDAGNTQDARPPLPDLTTLDPFEIFGLNISGTELGMEVSTQARGDEVRCEPLTPSMTLLHDGRDPVVIEASDCYNGTFFFEFTADAAPGEYELEFTNGNGAVHRPEGETFTIYESLGMSQEPIAPGLNPSLASNWEFSKSLIAAIDPADSTVFFLKRSRDFLEAATSNPRVATDVVANEVQIANAQDNTIAYVAYWASDTELGLMWLDDDGREVSTAPPPLSTVGPKNLDIVVSDRYETAVVWEDSAGEVQMAVLEVGGAEWINGPASAGPGTNPRVTMHSGIYDFVMIYDRAEGEAYTQNFEADRFNDMPLSGMGQLVPYDRANCDYSPSGSRYRICESYAVEGQPPRVLAYNGDDFIYPESAAIQVNHPASIISEPGESSSASWVFISFVDTSGGVTHEMWRDSIDGPFRVLGRKNQAYDGVFWDIDAAMNTLGTNIAWVAEVDGQIELGSISLPVDFGID